MSKGLNKLTWASQPDRLLKRFVGKPCRLCGEPGVCVVVGAYTVGPACLLHGMGALEVGYEVIFEEEAEGEREPAG